MISFNVRKNHLSEIPKKKCKRNILLIAPILLLTIGGVANANDIIIGSALDYQNSFELHKPYHQGQLDYAEVINENGGINGHKIRFIEDNHKNNAKLGGEIYRKMRSEGMIVFDPLSTMVANEVKYEVEKDNINMITIYSGPSDAANGEKYKWIYPLSPTYWSQAALLINYFSKESGGSLKGKSIAYISDTSSSGLGMSTYPFVKSLSDKLGFKLILGQYTRGSNLEEKKEVIKKTLNSKPDWILVWDGSPAKKDVYNLIFSEGFDSKKVGTLQWLSENEMEQIDQKAKGMVKFEGVGSGKGYKYIQQIEHEVIAKNKGHGPEEAIGTTPYNVGVFSIALIAEAARKATDKKGGQISAINLNRGFNEIRNFDGDGIAPPITITKKDHQGKGQGRIVQWDGKNWKPVTKWGSANQTLVWDFILDQK